MNYRGPRNAIPSCSGTPMFGFGSNRIWSGLGLGGNFDAGGTSFVPSMGFGSNRYGIGRLGGYSGCGCCRGRFGGFGSGSLSSGGTTSAASLGVLQGIQPKCINQLLSQEVVIEPSPVIVTLPGPIMSATPEPIRMGASTPCAAPGSKSLFGCGGLGGLGTSKFNNRGFLGRHGSVCLNPGFDVCH